MILINNYHMCWLRVLRRNSVNAFIICNKNNHYQDLGGEEQSFWLVSKRYIIEFYMQFGLQIPKLRCVCNFHVNMKFNNAHLFYSYVVLITHDAVFCICWAFANHCNCICANKIFSFVFNLSSWYSSWNVLLSNFNWNNYKCCLLFW